MEHEPRIDNPQRDDVNPAQAPHPTPAPRHNHKRTRTVVALAAIVALVGLVGAIFAALAIRNTGQRAQARTTQTIEQQARATPVLKVVPLNSQRGVPADVIITCVQMLSASDGWAAGDTTGGGSQSVILHYSNGRWNQVENVYAETAFSAIAMFSDTEGWAVGGYATGLYAPQSKTVILRDHHGVWSVVPLHLNGYLSSVSFVSPDEGWAVGQDDTARYNSLILHYSHGVWTLVKTRLDSVTDVSMASPTDGWIVTASNTLVHYQSGKWSEWYQKPIGALVGVQMLSARSGWAVGSQYPHQPPGGMANDPYFLRFDGSSWQEVAAPSDLGPMQLLGLAALSPTQVWAVGGSLAGATNYGEQCLVLQYHNGVWNATALPYSGQITNISMVSANEGWAVGYTYNGATDTTGQLLLHYHNGVWSAYSA